ncbi:MAG: N-acyl homoserine lactonase family protein [Gemmatimonadota bacterium]|nr:N-acyl homoserine lactonase family protein [Gemmatimonadota bacterium]
MNIKVLAGAAALLAAAARPTAPVYDVYAVSYAIIPGFPVAGLVAGADTSRRADIQMMVWLVRGNGHTMLLDAGFYRDKFMKRWKPRDYVRPSEAIAKLGLKPEDVTDVVISHMHWDHADGADLFPNAKIWIQREEFDHYTNAATRFGGADSLDATMMLRLDSLGRVMKVAGDDQEILPGIRVYTGGKHTWQSQYASVPTASGTVVLASDNAYLYENLERHRPIAQTLDSLSNLAAQERMKTIASNVRFIVPGHDPLVFVKFPKPGNGIAKIE